MNFGFASLIAATVALYHPDWTPEPWQLLLIFYAICLLAFVIVAYGNKLLPMVDTICAAFTAISILITLICLSAKASAGRHSARDTLVGRMLLFRMCWARLIDRRGTTTRLSPAGGDFHSSSASFLQHIREQSLCYPD